VERQDSGPAAGGSDGTHRYSWRWSTTTTSSPSGPMICTWSGPLSIRLWVIRALRGSIREPPYAGAA
jgi:hypothetical protein